MIIRPEAGSHRSMSAFHALLREHSEHFVQTSQALNRLIDMLQAGELWPDELDHILVYLDRLRSIIQDNTNLFEDPTHMPPALWPQRYRFMSLLFQLQEQLDPLRVHILAYRPYCRTFTKRARSERDALCHRLWKVCEDTIRLPDRLDELCILNNREPHHTNHYTNLEPLRVSTA